MRQTNTQRPTVDGLFNKVCNLLSFRNGQTESDENRGWLDWSMHADLPNPIHAEVVFEAHDGGYYRRPVTQSELNSIVYSDRPWELHMEFDDRAIKEDSFNQLRQMVRHSRHGNGSAASRIEICTPQRSAISNTTAWQIKLSLAVPLRIKRVEVFEANATVHDVLTRIAGGMCYGFFEGLDSTRSNRALSPQGRPVFHLMWGT
jgi:hypothetical protein